jgi:hypothetical protein
MNKCDPCQKHLLVARLKALRDCAHGVPVRSPSLAFRGACAFADRVPVLERRLAAATADRDLYQIGADIRDLEQQAKNIPVRYAVSRQIPKGSPWVIAADNSVVYVFDVDNVTVSKYTTTGAFQGLWTMPGLFGSNNYLYGIGADNGEIYITDLENSLIRVFTPSGTLVRNLPTQYLGSDYFPKALCISPDGLYTTERRSGTGRYFQRNITTGAAILSGASSFYTSALCCDGTKLYLAYSGLGSCGVSSVVPGGPGSTSLYSGRGSGDNDLDLTGYASGIGVNGNSLYIVDTNNNRIQVMDKTSGAFQFHWGSLGFANGQFNAPQGVAIYDNIVYVADVNNGRIQSCNLDGTFIRKWNVRK